MCVLGSWLFLSPTFKMSYPVDASWRPWPEVFTLLALTAYMHKCWLVLLFILCYRCFVLATSVQSVYASTSWAFVDAMTLVSNAACTPHVSFDALSSPQPTFGCFVLATSGVNICGHELVHCIPYMRKHSRGVMHFFQTRKPCINRGVSPSPRLPASRSINLSACKCLFRIVPPPPPPQHHALSPKPVD